MDKLELEKQLKEKGYRYVAGVDEVGRGPLAGPVVCCAIIMPEEIIEGVDDSKKLSEKKREKVLKKSIKNQICHRQGYLQYIPSSNFVHCDYCQYAYA